jgi:hypothetical protein
VRYLGQQVVMAFPVATGLQFSGHAVAVGGIQSLSSTSRPLEHRTPTLTSPPEPLHVVEQDLGGVNSVAAESILIDVSEVEVIS